MALWEGSLWKINAILAFFPFFLGYGFAQGLTDSMQVDTDSISAPYRPLSMGIVSVKSVRSVSYIGLILASSILIYLNYRTLIFGLMTILGLATYTYFKKNFWWAGPFYNAWIVVLLPVMGYLVATGGNFSIFQNSSLPWLIGLSFFSYANFVLIGYLKDITADRETGYRTFPVIFGWNVTVWVGDLFVLLSMGCAVHLMTDNLLGWICYGLASLIALSGQIKAHFTKVKIEPNAAYPIVSTVRSFILWHLAVVVAFQPTVLGFAIVFYILFEWSLWSRPEQGQI
jgi:4-hydroxybenzoate polyprenyltransferase